MTKWQAIVAALKGGAWWSAVETLLGIGVTIGILTADQDQVVLAAITGALNLIQLIQTAVHTFQAAKLLRANAKLVELKPGPDGVYSA